MSTHIDIPTYMNHSNIYNLLEKYKGVITDLDEVTKKILHIALEEVNKAYKNDEMLFNYISYFIYDKEDSDKKRIINLIEVIEYFSDIDEGVEFLENVQFELTQSLVGSFKEKGDYFELLTILNSIINIDKKIMRNVGKVRESNDINNILPSLMFRIKKEYDGYRVIQNEGDLKDRIVKNGKDYGLLCEVFGDKLSTKVEEYLTNVMYSGIEEFDYRTSKGVLRIILKVDENNKNVVNGNILEITEIDKAGEEARKLAFYDSLTDLPNRDLFYRNLNELIEMDAGDVGVLFIDIDDFKYINDNYGHNVGDEILKQISRRLETCVRQGDLVARLAGDEFTILCKNIDGDSGLERVASRIIEVISSEEFKVFEYSIDVTLSVGVSSYPKDGKDSATIVENADIAMYKAKSSGKNKYKLFDESMSDEIVNKLQVQNDLRKAIKREELLVEYLTQYEVGADNKRNIIGLEALVRWDHPERGVLNPIEFIDVAEETGLIVEMGYWVIEEGLKRLKEWKGMLGNEVKLYVNLSSSQFFNKDLITRVGSIIEGVGLSSECLVVEITEKTSMSNVSETIKVLNGLKKLGVSVSIDDFGTGYSSLLSLSDFGVKTLKIDKSFISKLGDDSKYNMVVDSIIGLSKTMSLELVAEGVENKDQLRILKDLGCSKFQGYYFNKPLKDYEVVELLKK